ncbi:DUF4836 family protein [Taibaiella lutea]|uniref:DUF4836 family protein n=1 Tax=Taibaiella lutea TaxID=2608001 RepID=A0A5M6CNA7_9BACT|nr:DUF4836 family protein [Taibaiella lutea]KAA5536533.1 DUF4836 family protein [Taibaiella lutea]
MRKMLRFVPIILCFSIFLSSCSSTDSNTKYISKDAIGVLSINTTQLAKKVAINAISGSPIFQDMLKKAGSDTTALDIEKTGIDPLNVFYIYGLADKRLSGKSKFMMIIPLKNATNFKAFIKEKFPEAVFSQKGKLNFVKFNTNICMGWDEKTAIASAATPNYDEWNSLPSAAPVDMVTIMTEDIEKTFSLDKEQSLANNPKFATLQKENHDISFWLNYEGFINGMPQEQVGTAGMILASQKNLLKDIYVAGGLDFEKGKIVSDATYYFNPAIKGISEALEPKSINNDLLKRVPGQQMNLMMSYHFNPKGLIKVLETMNVLPLAVSGLKEYGLTLDDVTKAFTGDFLLAVTDFSVASESKSYTMNGVSINQTAPVPSFKASLSFKINDKPSFDKIMQLVVNNELMSNPTPGVYTLSSFATLVTNGEYAAVSNDAAVASAFMQPGNSKFDVPSDVKNQPYGFYADIKNSVKSIPLDLIYGKEDTAVFHDGRLLLESINAYGGKLEGDHTKFHFEILFQDKGENSLMQLIKFSQKIAEAEMKQPDSIDEVIPQDESEEADSALAI